MLAPGHLVAGLRLVYLNPQKLLLLVGVGRLIDGWLVTEVVFGDRVLVEDEAEVLFGGSGEPCGGEVVDGCHLFEHLELVELILDDLVYLLVAKYVLIGLLGQAPAEYARQHHQQLVPKVGLVGILAINLLRQVSPAAVVVIAFANAVHDSIEDDCDAPNHSQQHVGGRTREHHLGLLATRPYPDLVEGHAGVDALSVACGLVAVGGDGALEDGRGLAVEEAHGVVVN